jgi:hypothetical protein
MQAVLNGQDTTSYIYKTYNWLLSRRSIFEDGDVFSCFGEAEFDGIYDTNPFSSVIPYECTSTNTCQFPSLAAYNQWVRDFTGVLRAVFKGWGLNNVEVDWWSFSGGEYEARIEGC